MKKEYKNVETIIKIMKKYKLDIISLLMIIICMALFGTVGLIISFLLMIVYLISTEKKYKFHKFFIYVCFVGFAIAFLGLIMMTNMENTGIDGIGEAIMDAIIYKAGIYIVLFGSISLFIADNKKFIFKKSTLLVLLLFLILACLSFVLYFFVTTEKVSDNIPSLSNFENELIDRNLKNTETDYRLYGIDGNNEKALSLTFEENDDDKYPLYVYSIIDYPWIIYYANGDLYAVKGEYWDENIAYNEPTELSEEKIIWDNKNIIISSKESVYVYNPKYNRYQKGKLLVETGFDYYSKDEDKENSIFIDIPSVESWGYEITKVDNVDKETLDSISTEID